MWSGVFTGQANANAGLALAKEGFTRAVYQNTHRFNITWGQDDPVAPLRTGKMLEAQLTDASLAIIAGAGHVPIKSHPHLFNRLLITALTEDPAPDIRPAEPATEIPSESINCSGENNRHYRGIYAEVVIDNCHGVVLTGCIPRTSYSRSADLPAHTTRGTYTDRSTFRSALWKGNWAQVFECHPSEGAHGDGIEISEYSPDATILFPFWSSLQQSAPSLCAGGCESGQGSP